MRSNFPAYSYKYTALAGLTLFFCLLVGCSSRPGGWFSTPTVLKEFTLSPVNKGMGRPVQLTAFTSDELQGRLSPDGLSLIYASNQKGNLDIWLRNLSTGIPRALTRHVAADSNPVFSPDGKSVVFVSMRDDVKGDLYMLEIDDDEPRKLTDRSTADNYPVFSPDGASILYASGPEGRSRIMRYALDTGKSSPMTDWGATQPAISPDGRLLAYIQRDADGMNRLKVMRLPDRKIRSISTLAYQCGFPSFSSDGITLFFTRFYYTHSKSPLTGDENGVIFAIDTDRIWKAKKDRMESVIRQISSGRQTHLFLQAHSSGLLFTTSLDGNLDIWMVPHEGLLPKFDEARQQLDFALSLTDPLDRLLALRAVKQFKGSVESEEALYLSSRIDHGRKWFNKQRSNLMKLDRIKDPKSDWQGLARVDLAMWDVESTEGRSLETGVRLEPRQVEKALEKLAEVKQRYASDPRVLAYALFSEGEMLSMLERHMEAVEPYERVLSEFPEEGLMGIRARIGLGKVYSMLRTWDLQVNYYTRLFYEYPEFEVQLRHAIELILEQFRSEITSDASIDSLLNPPEFDDSGKRIAESLRNEQSQAGEDLVAVRMIYHMRTLIDRHPELQLLGAVLQLKTGRLYKRLGQLDLAIHAMKRVLDLYPGMKEEVTAAAFDLGAYSLELSRKLRAEGRFNEAGHTYADALGYYEQITGMYPPEHEYHRRARSEFISLGLLKAGQDERVGDIQAARRSYRRLLKFDRSIIQAQRKLIFYGVKAGKFEELKAVYKNMIKENAADFVGHYCLGYLLSWSMEPDSGDLEEAEEELLIARHLNSPSPYSHLTLGWIYEMKELYLGDTGSGWLEEAIDSYMKAYALNDRGADLQGEADILLNLGNVFSRLGNTWKQAYDFYSDRLELNLPLILPEREALYFLTFGRSAFNIDRYDEATSHFEHALEIARQIGNKTLEAELIARLALNYHMQNNYDTSTRFFERSIETYREVGQMDALTALTRSIALNHIKSGKLEAARKKLEESLELLKLHGTREPEDFTRLAIGDGMSLAPHGFSSSRETDVNSALSSLISEDLEQFISTSRDLDIRIEMLDAWLGELGGEEPDVMRELAVLWNRRARLARDAGRDRKTFSFFNNAYLLGESIQSVELDPEDERLVQADPETRSFYLSELDEDRLMMSLSPDDFAVQALNATSAAEVLLNRLASGREVRQGEIETQVKRLHRVAGRLEILEVEGERVIDEELSWRLYNDLALLSLAGAAAPRRLKKQNRPGPASTFKTLLAEAAPYVDGIRYLTRVIDATAPPEDIELEQAESDASPYRRLRAHLQALFNLSELSAVFQTEKQQAKTASRSFRLLDRVVELCGQYRVADVCLAAKISRANRLGDEKAIDALLTDYMAATPGALGPDYLQSSASYRQRMFAGVISRALESKDWQRALFILEMQNQRLVADELAGITIGVNSPEANGVLKSIAALEQDLNSLVQGQSYWENEKDRLARSTAIEKQQGAVKVRISDLAKLSPRLHDLLFSTGFPPPKAQAALKEDQVILSLVPQERDLYLIASGREAVRGRKLNISPLKLNILLSAYRKWYFTVGGAAKKQENSELTIPSSLLSLLTPFEKILGEMLADVDLAYIDFDRVSTRFPIRALLFAMGVQNITTVNISSLGGLARAYGNRNIYKDKGLITNLSSTDRPEMVKVFEQLVLEEPGYTMAEMEDGRQSKLMHRIENNGLLFINQPLVFEGRSAANAWLRFKTETPGFGHYPFAGHLDGLWKSNLAIFSEVNFTRREREERLVLARILFSYGLPGFVLLAPDLIHDKDTASSIKELALKVKSDSRASALRQALGKLTTAGSSYLADGMQLYGYAGMDEEEALAWAKANLMPTIQRGIAAQKAGAARTAVETYEQALVLIDHLGDNKFLSKILDMLVSQSKQISDFKRTIKYQQRILDGVEAELKTDPKKIVLVLNAKKSLASYYTQDRQYDRGLEVNGEIIETLEKAGRQILCAPYYSQRGLINEYGGRYKAALAAYEEAYRIYTIKKDTAGRLSESRNAARILRQRLSDYQLAKTYVETALTLAQKADPYDRLLLVLGLSRIQLALGNFQTALDLAGKLIEESRQRSENALAEAMKLFKDPKIPKDKKPDMLKPLQTIKLRMDSLVILGYVEMVNTLFRQGNYAQAMAIIKTGMALAQKSKDIRKQILFNNVKGLIYSFLGNPEKAILTFEWTLEQARLLGDQGEVASAYNNLGDAYRKAGRFNKARNMFTKAMEIDLKTNFTQGLAYDYANIGLVFESMHRPNDARENLSKALKISRQIQDPLNEAKSLLALGRIHLRTKKLENAEKLLSEGLALCDRLNMTDWSWKFRLQLGRLERRRDKLQDALAHFNAGIEIVEPQGPAVRVAKSGPKLEEDKGELYDEAISCLADLNRSEQAFHLAERARARRFLDAMGGGGLAFAKHGVAEQLAREATMRSALVSARDRFLKAGETGKEAAKQDLEEARRNYDDTLARLAELDSELPSYVKVDARTYEELKSLIPEDTALLSYYQSADRLIVWIATSEALIMHAVDQPRSVTRNKVEAFRHQMIHFHPVEKPGGELYRLLLSPLEKQWAAKARLVIIPFGMLNQLPFTALYDGENFLLEKRAVSMLSSANQLRFIDRAEMKTPAAAIVGIGGAALNTAAGLEALPFTRQELGALASSYPRAEIHLDQRATETAFKALAQEALWLHIASHSAIDRVNPLDSALLLQKDGSEDGRLHLHEVLGMDLSAELVSLSACDSATGTLSEGNEIIGLSRAFLTAGASRVLASQWRVSDLSTAILMKHFFRQLKEHPAPEALRNAQQKVRQAFPHPAYWAGFRLEGSL